MSRTATLHVDGSRALQNADSAALGGVRGVMFACAFGAERSSGDRRMCAGGAQPTGESSPSRSSTVVPFKPGLMRGERLFYDAAMIYERAGLDVHELRAAASRADA
jgi:hypothetical protein